MECLDNAIAAADENAAAKQRMLSRPFEPLFIADWERVVMIHFEVDAGELQPLVPFELDLREGHAYVSAVAFTMRGMRPRWGGSLTRWMLRPISSPSFLNARTYVRHGNESGIYFMAEWLSNWLSVLLGPLTFGLPYRFGKISYDHDSKASGGKGLRRFEGAVKGTAGCGGFHYTAKSDQAESFGECAAGSLDHWLMERYTAFTAARGKARFFRVWHAPWLQMPIASEIHDPSLLTHTWPFLAGAQPVRANYSPGARSVWMGWPHRLPLKARSGTFIPRASWNRAKKAF